MKPTIIKLTSLFLLLILIQSCTKAQERIRVSFNENWTFQKGETGTEFEMDFDDAAWRTLDVPHDWAIEGPFDQANDARTGGLPIYGTAWYRKTFTMEASQKGNQVSVAFDGVMNNAEVYINEKKKAQDPLAI